jgi:hypothetical protein
MERSDQYRVLLPEGFDPDGYIYYQSLDEQLCYQNQKEGGQGQVGSSILKRGPRRYELARIFVNKHHSVSFEVIPQLQEVSYSETIALPPGSASQFHLERGSASPARRFLDLTKSDMPVPRILLDFDEDSDADDLVNLLRARDIVDDVGSSTNIPNEPPDLAGDTPAAAAVAVCGSGGSTAFANAYCESKGVSYCDNGGWYSLVRTSGSTKTKISHSRTSSCQTTTTVFHFYRGWWFGWKWFYVSYAFNSNQQFVPHGWYKYWKHVGGAKRRRKVERYRTSSNEGGYFRAWTGFYN